MDIVASLSILGIVVLIAIIFLKGFDRIAGRGPKQVSDGINRATSDEGRIPCPMCAERILPEARICPFCKSELKRNVASGTAQVHRAGTHGGQVITDAEIGHSPPNTQHAWAVRVAALLGIGIFIIFVAAVIITNRPPAGEVPIVKGPDYNEVTTERAHPSSNALGRSPSSEGIKVPEPEQAFASLVASFVSPYNSADSEVRKTNVRFERKEALARFFGGSLLFHGWVGNVESLTTEKDGHAAISVKLPGSETVIGTWNNSLSDVLARTMISREDLLYQSLMSIKEGDLVTVSGTFLSSESDYDYILEMSLTEAGAMQQPEFVVRFSQIDGGSDPNSRSSDAEPSPGAL
jgi:hypothetical protein